MKRKKLITLACASCLAIVVQAQTDLRKLKADQLENLRRLELSQATRAPRESDGFSVGSKEEKRLQLKNPMKFGVKPTTSIRSKHKIRKATSEIFDAGWSNTLRSQDEFEQFTVIDANADGKTWDYRAYDVGGETQYSYNKEKQADDWLITPGIRLKGGKTYYVTFKSRCVQPTYNERIEVKYGIAATAEGMTTEVLPPTDIKDNNYISFKQAISPAQDGVYYIGFHAISDAFKYALFLADVSVVAAPEPQSPASVTELSVVANQDAALKATVSFKTPSLAFDGSNLMQLSGVRILCNGEEKANIATTEMGKQITFTDENVPTAGLTHFTVIPYNAHGEGLSAVASAYVGLDFPDAPTEVRLSNDPTNMELTWKAPAAAHGGVIKEENIIYHVYTVAYDNYGTALLKDQIEEVDAGTTIYQLGKGADEGTPAMLELAVQAENGAGVSDAFSVSNAVLLGSPFVAPFVETFANAEPKRLLIPFAEGTGVTYGAAGAGFTVDEDANGDGGCSYLQTLSNDSVGYKTFKIDIKTTTHPQLVFSKKTRSQLGKFAAFVEKPNGEIVYLLDEDFETRTPSTDWEVYKFDLSAFKSERYVLIGFNYKEQSGGFEQQNVYIDDLHIGDIATHDVQAFLTVPKKMKRGESATALVRVNNVGNETVESYKITASIREKIVFEKNIEEPLASFKNKVIEVPFTANVLLDGSYFSLKVDVVAMNDADLSNNTTSETIDIIEASISPVEDLAAKHQMESNKNRVTLSWKKPSPLVKKTESFEDYADWSISDIAPWKLVDKDFAETGGNFVYNGNTEVEYEHKGERFAYIVFTDRNFGGYDLQSKGIMKFAANTGNKCLASMWGASYDFGTNEYQNTDNNDWLISPEISGTNISFFVKNLIAQTADGEAHDLRQTVEVLCSMTDQETESFQPVDTCYAEGGMWKAYNVTLPEGTKYFALRNITKAADAFLLMLDDVTYSVYGGEAQSYNVYRNGERIGNTSALSFVDEAVADGTQIYQVTAVYGDGTESAPQTISIITSGVSTIENNTAKVFDVYTTSGTLYRKNARNINDLPKGIYIVDGRKIVVR